MGKHILEDGLKTINGNSLLGEGDIVTSSKVDNKSLSKNSEGEIQLFTRDNTLNVSLENELTSVDIEEELKGNGYSKEFTVKDKRNFSTHKKQCEFNSILFTDMHNISNESLEFSKREHFGMGYENSIKLVLKGSDGYNTEKIESLNGSSYRTNIITYTLEADIDKSMNNDTKQSVDNYKKSITINEDGNIKETIVDLNIDDIKLSSDLPLTINTKELRLDHTSLYSETETGFIGIFRNDGSSSKMQPGHIELKVGNTYSTVRSSALGIYKSITDFIEYRRDKIVKTLDDKVYLNIEYPIVKETTTTILPLAIDGVSANKEGNIILGYEERIKQLEDTIKLLSNKTSPDGSKWAIDVDNIGNLITSKIV